jgi:hypothetical protein
MLLTISAALAQARAVGDTGAMSPADAAGGAIVTNRMLHEPDSLG